MKERLRQYARLLNEIEIKERRAAAVDGLGGYIPQQAKKAIGERLERLTRQEASERECLTAMIAELPCGNERQVLFARYFDGHSWARVCELVFGCREDFDEKAESYQRRIFRIHGNALENLQKIEAKSVKRDSRFT